MGKTTKTRDAALKAKIAFEVAKGEKTISQLASDYGVHPNQPNYNIQWKKKLQEELPRQCELLGLSRSGYYYQPQGETTLNLHLMNLIDEQYTRMPFYGIDQRLYGQT
jgi:putative transposase